MKIEFKKSLSRKGKRKIFHICLLIMICCMLVSGLAACGTDISGKNKVEYHNEAYGFSLSIPDEIYENITIEENLTDIDGGNIDFIYSKENEDGSEAAGILFSIKIYDKKMHSNIQDTDSMKIMGENDIYYFCFAEIAEPIEDMSFEKIYKENKDKILKIADTFKLD